MITDGTSSTSWLKNLQNPIGSLVLSPENGCNAFQFYAQPNSIPSSVLQLIGSSYLLRATAWEIYDRDLHNNNLTRPIPPPIGRLKRLKILYAPSIYFLLHMYIWNTNLRWNKLQDALPLEIGELKSLTHLSLSYNNFKGEIHKELANLPQLRYLYLQENRFIGRVPPELGTLPNLCHLDVGNNHLVGTIREIIRIKGCFIALRNLYLNNNYLTGGIPAQLANLTNLEILYLSYNKMTGVVPAEIAKIAKLTFLYLDHNQFSGRISDAFYKHPFLERNVSFVLDSDLRGLHVIVSYIHIAS